MLNRTRVAVIAAAAVALALASSLPGLKTAQAQTPSNPAPYNVDLGALITNAARQTNAAAVTTGLQANTNWRGVVCVNVPTASSGSTSTTWKIQGYDAATATYYDMLTSADMVLGPQGSQSLLNTAYTLMVYPGIQTSSLPANMSAISLHLPRTWRISQTIATSGGSAANSAQTSRIGCNYLL